MTTKTTTTIEPDSFDQFIAALPRIEEHSLCVAAEKQHDELKQAYGKLESEIDELNRSLNEFSVDRETGRVSYGSQAAVIERQQLQVAATKLATGEWTPDSIPADATISIRTKLANRQRVRRTLYEAMKQAEKNCEKARSEACREVAQRVAPFWGVEFAEAAGCALKLRSILQRLGKRRLAIADDKGYYSVHSSHLPTEAGFWHVCSNRDAAASPDNFLLFAKIAKRAEGIGQSRAKGE